LKPRLEALTDQDLFARVRLVDANGNVQLLRQIAVWDASHVLGGAAPTSTWTPGLVISESLDVIIPWRVAPGAYALGLWLYENGAQSHAPLRTDGRQPSQGLALGELHILPRE
jgi:hypothetical protein